MTSTVRRMGATLLLVTVAAATAGAQEKKKERDNARPADIQVLAIRASTRDKDVSPELRELAEKLKKQFNFTGFKLERRQSGRTDVGNSFETALIGEYRAEVTLKENDGHRVELRIEVWRGKEKDKARTTTVRVKSGESQLFGGMPLEGGDVLIVAFSAR